MEAMTIKGKTKLILNLPPQMRDPHVRRVTLLFSKVSWDRFREPGIPYYTKDQDALGPVRMSGTSEPCVSQP